MNQRADGKHVKSGINVLLTVIVWASLAGYGVCRQPPPCQWEKALDCGMYAVDQAKGDVGCNADIIMPRLSLCVDNATAGCHGLIQQDWVNYVINFNYTLHRPECKSECVNQTQKEADIESCKTKYGDMVPLTQLIVQLFKDNDDTTEGCTTLKLIGTCMSTIAWGCPWLEQKVLDFWNTDPNIRQALAVCGDNIKPTASPTTTANPKDGGSGLLTGEDGGTNIKVEWVIIVVIVVLVLIVVNVIAVLLYLRHRNRKRQKRKEPYREDWDDKSDAASVHSFYRPRFYY